MESFDVISLKKNIVQALRTWHLPGGNQENYLQYLLLFEKTKHALEADGDHVPNRLVTNSLLLSGIDDLELRNERLAEVLTLRFPDDNSLLMVAHNLNISQHSVSRLQREAIEQLCGIIFDRETQLRSEQIQHIETFLPPAQYSQLFGLDEVVASLSEKISVSETQFITIIVGIGGIGKTSLADRITRTLLRSFKFEQVLWLRIDGHSPLFDLSSPQATFETLISNISQQIWPQSAHELTAEEKLIQVRHTLKTRPFLIVIDNLEAEEETAFLLNYLHDLANPSKFILTSRIHLTNQSNVFHYSLNELSYEHAKALLFHYAAEIGIHVMQEATDKEIKQIYAITGGNPLALRLVVSLLDLFPLPKLLADMQHGRPGDIESMYKHIYWKSWKSLSDRAKDLLMAMTLVDEFGALPDFLQTTSQLNEDDFWPALQELRGRSLLEARGTLLKKRYGIHQLTDTFLKTEIVKWDEV